MSKIAFIYPGQGAQFVGMGKDVAEKFESADRFYRLATSALNQDMKELVFYSDDETLKITENTQPALLTTCIALTQPLLDNGIVPDVSAGLSIGEYAAHVIAGSFSFEDAVQIVKKRGKFMQEEVPLGVGGMAAIMGLEASDVEECCCTVSGKYPGMKVEPANYNCPGQIVIAGNVAAVEEAAELCKRKGAKRALMLAVSAPFHCSLLKGAGEKLDAELAKVDFQDMKMPVVSNVTATYTEDKALIRESLFRQVSSPVKWEQCIKKMLENGVTTFVEIGPGKTLAGFMKKIDKNAAVYNVSDLETLSQTLTALSKG